jgi:hypothetical protein
MFVMFCRLLQNIFLCKLPCLGLQIISNYLRNPRIYTISKLGQAVKYVTRQKLTYQLESLGKKATTELRLSHTNAKQ